MGVGGAEGAKILENDADFLFFLCVSMDFGVLFCWFSLVLPVISWVFIVFSLGFPKFFGVRGAEGTKIPEKNAYF